MENKKDMNSLASKLTKMNEGKSKIKIGDARELIKNLKELIKKDPLIVAFLLRK